MGPEKRCFIKQTNKKPSLDKPVGLRRPAIERLGLGLAGVPEWQTENQIKPWDS